MDGVDIISYDKYNTVFREIVKIPDINIIKVVGCLVAWVVNALACAVGVCKCNGFNIIQQTNNSVLLYNLATGCGDVNKACISVIIVITAALPIINLSVIRECYKLIVKGITFQIKLTSARKVGQHCATYKIARCVALIVSSVKQC